jgi:hypothetical protein
VQSLLRKNPVRIERVMGMTNGEEVAFRLASPSKGSMEPAAASRPG